MVCRASAMIGREKKSGRQIQDMVVSFSIGIGIVSLAYSETSDLFLLCMGKEERFRFDFENFDQQQLSLTASTAKLNFFHPFRLSVNIAAFSFIFIVPICYHKIFKFRRLHDRFVRGISNNYD